MRHQGIDYHLGDMHVDALRVLRDRIAEQRVNAQRELHSATLDRVIRAVLWEAINSCGEKLLQVNRELGRRQLARTANPQAEGD